MVAEPDARFSSCGRSSYSIIRIPKELENEVMDEKSRHEMIMRAKLSYAEQNTNLSARAWVDRELNEIGMDAMTDAECKIYELNDRPRIFQDV